MVWVTIWKLNMNYLPFSELNRPETAWHVNMKFFSE